LTPVFTFTGSVVSNNGAQLISGSGTVNFTTAQQFDVYAADGSVQAYTVTVTNAPASIACLLTGFSIGGQAATIDQGGKTVSLTVPYGTDRSSLTPTITSSPFATVNPASGVARNFTSAVQYTVTAEDAAYSNVYTVTVSEAAPSAECQLLSFSLEGVAGTIDHGRGDGCRHPAAGDGHLFAQTGVDRLVIRDGRPLHQHGTGFQLAGLLPP
jgi:hypothetical protein